MPIDPIKIPQNVHIEDRIVGPLTLKQIIIVAIGCGFSYALYTMLLRTMGEVPLPLTVMVWVPGALSGIFAFLRINDLSLFRICLLMVERINKPSVRTWSPRRGIVVNIRTYTTPDEKHKRKFEETLSRKNPLMIDELSAMLDQPKAKKEEALSPLEETVTEDDMTEPLSPFRPVDPTRISASTVQPGLSTDTLIPPSPPKSGAVSIFRDISPAAHV
jgi:hypothetical protein